MMCGYLALSSSRFFLYNLGCRLRGTRLAGDSFCAGTEIIQDSRASVHTLEW